MFCSLKRLMALVFVSALGMTGEVSGMIKDQDQIKKIGIELELQDITYDNTSSINVVDHLRIFESNEKDESGAPNWYLEVDGSGNIEFVTRAFLSTEVDLLRKSNEQIHKLCEHILSNAKNPKNFEDPYLFSVKKETVFEDVGTWTLIGDKKNLSPEELKKLEEQECIEILIQDPTFKVRPQATFEFPFSLIPQFSNYMSEKHEKLLKAVTKVNKRKKPEDISDNDLGFQYLISLYVELLNSKKASTELGPKGQLPLMSRKSFSSYEIDDLENFNKFTESFEGKSFPLFGANYKIYFGGDLSERSDVKEIIDSLTVESFFKSITDGKITQNDREKAKKIWSTVCKEAKGDDLQPAEIILRQIKESYFDSKEDYLSPPLFMSNAYSLGKQTKKSKNSIIEMRGYTASYSNNMKMGKLVHLWLKREIDNFSKQWKDNLTSLDEYKEQSKIISNAVEQSEWKKIEIELQDTIAKINAPKKINSIHINTSDLKKLANKYSEEMLKQLLKDNKENISNFYDQKKIFGISLISSKI